MIYNAENLISNSTLEKDLETCRTIDDISRMRGNSKDYLLEFSKLPNALCNNQAVWHPNIPGAIVASKEFKLNSTITSHQIDIISEQGRSVGMVSSEDLPLKCHSLITSKGGIALLNCHSDGTISLYR
jgi:hypothetical protein